MNEKPDFIVDPSGHARDVRGVKYSQASQDSSSQGPPTGPPVYYTSKPGSSGSSGGNKRPSGVIFIPIGLIVTLILVVLRMMAGSWQSNSNSTTLQQKIYSDASANALNMGVHYYSRGEYDKAIVHFNLALGEEPEMVEAYNNRALAYEALGQNDLALADLNKAIQLDPEAASSYSNRGALYFSTGDDERSLADLDKAIALDPNLAKAYQNRGLTYMDLGYLEQAIADFSQAIELTPEFIFSAQSTAQSRSTQEENSLFLGFQQDILNSQAYADLPHSYASRAMAYLQNGQLELAGADLVKARQFGLEEDMAGQIEALLVVAGYVVMPEAGESENASAPVYGETGPGIAPVEPTARPEGSVPRAGHWQGISERAGYRGEVSFEVDSDEIMRGLVLELNFGMDKICEARAEVVPRSADGSFSLVFGEPGMEGVNIIQGKFGDETTIAGQTGTSILCTGTKGEFLQYRGEAGWTWSAKWVSYP